MFQRTITKEKRMSKYLVALAFVFSLAACGQTGEEDIDIGPENTLLDRRVREPTQSEDSVNAKVSQWHDVDEHIVYGHENSFHNASLDSTLTTLQNMENLQKLGMHNFLSFSVLTNNETYAVLNACANIKSFNILNLNEVVLYSEEVSFSGTTWAEASPNTIWMGIPHVSERVCTYHAYEELYDLEKTKNVLLHTAKQTFNRELFQIEKNEMTDMLDFLYYKTQNLFNPPN